MKKLSLNLNIIIALLFFLPSIFAQNTCTISGVIVDKQTSAPLFYVNTGLLSTADSTIINMTNSDEKGAFQFANIKSGNYILKIHYAGYEVFQQPFTVEGNLKEMKIDTLFLVPASNILSSISVSTTKPIYMNDGEKVLYNVSEDTSIQTGTAADALQNAPGVEVDIEGNITLRGVSSVEIWINDRPSKLSAENLKTYIQNLPANALERIEVITNPSARYSAKGSGGIINIITKENIKKNSFFSFGLNGSTRPMVSPWASYMFANEKFSINLYLNGHYSSFIRKNNGYSIIFNNDSDTSSFRSYNNKYTNGWMSGGGYLSGSYKFDSLKTISFWGNMWGDIFDKHSSFDEYQYREYIDHPGIYDYTEEAQGKESWRNGYFGADYEHNFNDDGHGFVVEIYGGFYKNSETNSLIRKFAHYPNLYKDYKKSYVLRESSMSAKFDYTLPYHENGEIEIGVSSEWESNNYLRQTDTLFDATEGIYSLDSLRYEDHKGNNFQIDLYTTVQHTFGNFTIKGGLRFQNYICNFNTLNKPELDGRKYYPGLFPSLHLSYKTKKMHNFNLSYSRRITYPDVDELNPFIIYKEDSYETGNVNLRPTYTNAIEGGWTKYFEKFGSVGLTAYFKNNKDDIKYLTDVIFDSNFGKYISYWIPVNCGKSYRLGSDLNVTWKLKTFMNIRLDASIYKNHAVTLFREEENIITNGLTYSFKLNFWAKLWKFLEVNASGNYRSKSFSIFYENHPSYSLNCGLRADFWNKKISVFLNVQDIFNWGRWGNNTTNPYYISYNSTKYSSRYISTGITFRFGKIEMESKARTGGNTE